MGVGVVLLATTAGAHKLRISMDYYLRAPIRRLPSSGIPSANSISPLINEGDWHGGWMLDD